MKRRILPHLIAASIACMIAGAANGAGVLAPDDDEDDLVPNGKGWGERAYPAPPRVNDNGPNANANANAQAGKPSAGNGNAN